WAMVGSVMSGRDQVRTEVKWVMGHAGDVENERADQAAGKAYDTCPWRWNEARQGLLNFSTLVGGVTVDGGLRRQLKRMEAWQAGLSWRSQRWWQEWTAVWGHAVEWELTMRVVQGGRISAGFSTIQEARRRTFRVKAFHEGGSGSSIYEDLGGSVVDGSLNYQEMILVVLLVDVVCLKGVYDRRRVR
ncbi:hypothetical protein HDU67_004639, partial [Dinochytrium kinnereticum]